MSGCKRSTAVSRFRLKEFTLPAGKSVVITRSQVIREFTTRVHHAGRHEVDVVVNGKSWVADFLSWFRAGLDQLLTGNKEACEFRVQACFC